MPLGVSPRRLFLFFGGCGVAATTSNEGISEMKSQLTPFQRNTYDAVFHHPTAHSLGWQNLRAILGTLGDVVEEHNGTLKVTRNGQTLVLYPPLDKNVTEVGELMEICRFLERRGYSPENGKNGNNNREINEYF
ncbi:MAG: hypothetical protein WCP87_02835 [Atribacterota bacterium]